MPERRRFHGALALAAALAAALVFVGTARAVTFEPREFDSEEQHRVYRDLTAELRCLVCQNQNLAESDAELAGDLRAEVYRMLKAGASREDVVAFMVDRYGDFVLYRPPLRASTVMLWVGPFVLAALALLVLVGHLRRRRQAPAAAAPLDEAERETLRRLVESEGPRRD